MRQITIVGLLVLCAGTPVRSEEGSVARDTALLNAARAAMEAQTRLGDLARQRGDLAGAERAYRQALSIYERATRRTRPAARKPKATRDRVRVTKDKKGSSFVETVPVEEHSPAKDPGRRRRAVKASDAIARAIDWLARNQGESGLWDASKFNGGALYDPGVTGLAVIALLGAGYLDRGETPYVGNVRRGLAALSATQDADGCFGSRAAHSFFYNHCVATTAMCQAYRLTRNPRYRPVAEKAIAYIHNARNPYMAWRYIPRGGENDTSVTTWAVIALTEATNAGLKVDPQAFTGALTWIEKMTEPKFGKVGYNFPGGSSARPEGLQDRFPSGNSEAMTAAALVVRACARKFDRTSKAVQNGTRLCLARQPAWRPDAGTIDMYYWYYGTIAMAHVGGQAWRTWNPKLNSALLSSQRAGGDKRGSWDPIGPWGGDGGRVYSTALMAITLQVSNRYDRAFLGPRKPR